VCTGAGPQATEPHNAAAVAAAVASLVKRAVAYIKAAGSAHAQASAYTATQGGASAGLAAHCFAGAVPVIIASLATHCVPATVDNVLQTAGRGSRAAEEQQRASAALLAVLLARSLVALTDAMDAAAEAAGMPPAQLYAR
jgi:hypothetical protein